MRRVVLHYQDQKKLEHFVSIQNLHTLPGLFVRIFTSGMSPREAVELARSLQSLLPTATIIGSAVPVGVIYNSAQFDGETIVIFDYFENLEVQLELISWRNADPEMLAEEVHTRFSSDSVVDKAVVNVLFSQDYRNAYDFANYMNRLTPFIKLVGGIVGDSKNGLPGFIFGPQKVFHDVLVAFAFYGDNEHSFTFSFNSFEVLSDEYTITKANAEYVEEIENRPALDWFCDYLSIDKKQLLQGSDFAERVNGDYLMNFPLVTDMVTHSGFFMQSSAKDSRLALYHSMLPQGQTFRLGYVNPDKTVRAMHELCTEILDIPVEELFVYTCLARKMHLQNFSKWEMAPFKKYNVCGIFLLGEFSHYKGKNYFNNGVSVFTGIAEKASFIIPDVLALEQSQIPTEDTSFFDKAMQMQKEHFSEKQAYLLSKIEQVTQRHTKDKYMDEMYHLPNIYQYELDRKKYKFDKICLMDVHTADATIAFAGEEVYIQSCLEALALGQKILSQLFTNYKVYLINYKTFVAVSLTPLGNEEFTDAIKKMHDQFEFVSSSETGLTGVVRYVVVSNHEDLLGAGTKFLYLEKNRQENFLVCDNSVAAKDMSKAEMESIALLKRALDNERIVPYYQGIYNNKLKKIDKCEALMRIVDLDGTVYSPFFFLETAKKYKFYRKISQMMIEKSMADFAHRSESLSINLSVYDLDSSNFRLWFIRKLRAFPDPSRIIVEFVETESYDSLDVLVEFLSQIQGVGSKVAVDDFGAGYSTLTMILAIKPEFIKIDGSIINDIVRNQDRQIILETVQYLATKIKAQTVAEFVENEKVQEFLDAMGVNFSQGYYFAKPCPIEEI